jgi:glycosyltransferase involved in cell wall biosynthesis
MSPQLEPKIICITPVKNEAWILDRFLKCASTWADHIIIADQGSTDGSLEIIKRYPKVMLVDAPCESFNMGKMRQAILATARTIPGPRIMIALDADESLSANWEDSPEWASIKAAKPGTVLRFQWANLMPDGESVWIPEAKILMGFVDDDSEYAEVPIDEPRVPCKPTSPSLVLKDIRVLHYQYTDWQRMQSKQRWYQVWERLNRPDRRPFKILRQYRHMYHVKQVPIPRHWLTAYEEKGIDMTSVNQDGTYRWDREVLDLFTKHGMEPFRKLDIWNIDWSDYANQIQYPEPAEAYRDPRSSLEKSALTWLQNTQPQSLTLKIRILQNGLRILGW